MTVIGNIVTEKWGIAKTSGCGVGKCWIAASGSGVEKAGVEMGSGVIECCRIGGGAALVKVVRCDV
jgi:hypothetical protein